jgi:hypothetical protein
VERAIGIAGLIYGVLVRDIEVVLWTEIRLRRPWLGRRDLRLVMSLVLYKIKVDIKNLSSVLLNHSEHWSESSRSCWCSL